MYEDDYGLVRRFGEVGERRLREPLILTYLWDKYGLDAELVNRYNNICRLDVDMAYEEDYNLRIMLTADDMNPFHGDTISLSCSAYNSDGDLEDGHLVLYKRSYNVDDPGFYLVDYLPCTYKVDDEVEFVAKFYTLDVTEPVSRFIYEEEVNLSPILRVKPRTYKDADLFVSRTGDDGGTGTLEDPYLTLQKALDNVMPGGTICILTDLDVGDGCLAYRTCEIIGKFSDDVDGVTLHSSNGVYLRVMAYTKVRLYKLRCDLLYDYTRATDISNQGSTIMSVESLVPKSYTDYKVSIDSTGDWISGSTVQLILNGVAGVQFYVFNSQSDYLGNKAVLDYTVPYNLDMETIVVVFPDGMYRQTFNIENITSDWYVNTRTGNDNNTGLSLDHPFKTIKRALEHATVYQPRIYYIGSEHINNTIISTPVEITGTSDSKFTTDNTYFIIQPGASLTFTKMMNNMSVRNNGTSKVEVIKI